MSTPLWITRLFGNTIPRAARRRDTPCRHVSRSRLAVERLEGRLAPATLTVNSVADTANPTDPYLSLREAIALVNSPSLPDGLSGQILGQISGPLHDGGADTIVSDTTQVTTPISLAGNQLELSLPGSTATITIDGGGVVAVDGANATRVFQVDPEVQATFAHLGIVRGYASGPGDASLGGGIYSRGLLTLTDCNLDANTSSGGVGGGLCNNGGSVTVNGSAVTHNAAVAGNGGGLYNSADGTLTVTDSLLRGNSAGGGGAGVENAGGQLTVTGSTLADNALDRSGGTVGGGIYNTDSGTARVTGSALSGNFAYYGGAIFNGGSGFVVVSGSTLDHNSGLSYGGGICNISGTLTVANSAITSNTGFDGGGIYGNEGAVAATACYIHGNSSGYGGGIESESGTLTVTNSTISSNGASGSGESGSGGGIINYGSGTVTGSTISNNGVLQAGGGIVNGGSLTLTNSTISSNTAIGLFAAGGGIANGGTLTVTNSTVSANFTNRSGGGIVNSGTLMVTSSTLSGNAANAGGGGIVNYPGSTTSLQNTIVAGNSTQGSGPDINGTVQSSSSYNLVGIGDGSLSGISDGTNHNQVGTAASPLDPGLLPLGDYGGPTYTMALLPGSPALDAGDPGLDGSPDQRGVIRTGRVNIGSFQASAVILFVYAPATVTAGGPFDVRVAAFDPYGLTDFGYTGTVSLSSSDPQVGLIGSHSYTLADAGSFTFSAVEQTPGPQTLTASDGTLTATTDLTVLPGAAPSHGSGPAASPRLGQSSGLLLGYDGPDSLTTASLGTVLVRLPDGLGPIH